MTLDENISKYLKDENLLPTVRKCIALRGGLHAWKNHHGEYYCRLSLFADKKACPYMGEPCLVYKKTEYGERWTRALKCTLYKS